MKNLLNILLVTFLMVSCSKKDHDCVNPNANDCLNTFMALNDLKKVESDQADCHFYRIYLFEGNYYFENECCVCDMITSILNCSGELYAAPDGLKYAYFKSNAVLQSIILVKK